MRVTTCYFVVLKKKNNRSFRYTHTTYVNVYVHNIIESRLKLSEYVMEIDSNEAPFGMASLHKNVNINLNYLLDKT